MELTKTLLAPETMHTRGFTTELVQCQACRSVKIAGYKPHVGNTTGFLQKQTWLSAKKLVGLVLTGLPIVTLLLSRAKTASSTMQQSCSHRSHLVEV